MLTHSMQFRVRYGETDQMGYVHHGNYAQYFEMGRIEWLRSIGISYKKMEEEGIILPVMELCTSYLHPAKYDDLLTLQTSLKNLPTARIEFDVSLYNQEGLNITKARILLAFVSAKTGKPTRPPSYLMKTLKGLFDRTAKANTSQATE